MHSYFLPDTGFGSVKTTEHGELARRVWDQALHLQRNQVLRESQGCYRLRRFQDGGSEP